MEYLQRILNQLLNADISGVNPEFIQYCGNEALRILDKKELNEYDIACMNLIIQICQILYNNTDRSLLPLEDGVYDLLLERDKSYNDKVQVGAPPIEFKSDGEIVTNSDIKTPAIFMDDSEEYKKNQMFEKDIGYAAPLYPGLYDQQIDRNAPVNSAKKSVSVAHNYPKLVGTLDKCKFTLNKEAKDRGVFDDRDVAIFERDFLGKHMQMGLFGPHDEITLILELKYDGISVEADVTDHIISARSRGDTGRDLAADLTPILGGYRFPFCPQMPENEQPFGMKFEAIISHNNLDKMSRLRGKSYKNARNGIIGLFGSIDGYNYRDLITLVPLATSMEDLDRVTEIEFMNKYYHSGEKLRYAVVTGTYNTLLYQVYKFVKEAERIRPIMPFMYDGVVVSYADPRIIQALGRDNSVNKYSVAIKFNPLVKQALFTGYTYTVGQNGLITPMLHFTPVEFYGTIHTKSSGHSFARFKELNLGIGDAVELEYRNDVMPYLTRCEDQPAWGSHNPPVQFPTTCPSCGGKVIFTDKSAFCTNPNCPERIIARVTNMMKKLNLKDFSSESLKSIRLKSLHELLNVKYEDVKVLGETNANKFMERVAELKSTPMYDYQIVGAIGFSNIAVETWKKILNKIHLQDIIDQDEHTLYERLINIKGIGPNTAACICAEREEFYDDLVSVCNEMPNVTCTTGITLSSKSIRFTGVRDEELCNYLCSLGYDANGNAGVTRNTDILIVPYDGFSSSKTSKCGPGTTIVDIASFKANMDKYLA
mgnify:FL=1